MLTIMKRLEAGTNPADVAPYIVTTSGELRDALTSASQDAGASRIRIQSGTYSTTDDGLGTFTYDAVDGSDLSIAGIGEGAVVLSGD